MTQFIHQPHDKLFKQSLADIRVARDFFEEHLPSELLQKVDLHTLKLQKQSFVDEAYKATEADVLYSVKIGKSLAYFYILCEHQSEIDESIAFRLLIYQTHIMEMHLKQNPKSQLPIVYPLVVYTGEKIWDAPLEIFDLFGEQKELAKEYLFKQYQLIEVHKLSDEDLKKHQWSGLVEFVLKYRQFRNLERFLKIIIPWLVQIEVESGETYINIVLKYIFNGMEDSDRVLFIQKTEQYSSNTLRGKVMTLAEQFKEEGRQQGIQQGMQEGKYELLLNLLEHKFKTVSEMHRQKLAQADTETLSVWGKRVLTVGTLDEVFE